MTKVKSIIILFIAVAGAFLIYHHFDKKEEDVVVKNKFASEYNLVDENNVFMYSSADEVTNTLENGTGFIFFCTPESTWCNYYAKYLNEELIKYDMGPVLYYNIRDDRSLNTIKYQKILTLLDQYLYKDDLLNSKIYMPDLTAVKDGVILGHDNQTSLIASDLTGEDYWTNEKVQEFKTTIKGFYDLIYGE